MPPMRPSLVAAHGFQSYTGTAASHFQQFRVTAKQACMQRQHSDSSKVFRWLQATLRWKIVPMCRLRGFSSSVANAASGTCLDSSEFLVSEFSYKASVAN